MAKDNGGIAPIGGSDNWGPRALEYGRNIVSHNDEGPLRFALDNRQPVESRAIIHRAAPSDVTVPDMSGYLQDSVTLSPEAKALMGH
jgi:hypothetical protein